jgi:hypothetical protein
MRLPWGIYGPGDPKWVQLSIPNDDALAVVHKNGFATLTHQYWEGDWLSGESEWTFDLKNLMPKRRLAFFFHTKTGKRHLFEVENYIWNEIAGVNLPVTIHREVKQRAQEAETGKIVEYSEIYDTVFKWNRVNASIPNELFDWNAPKSLQDVQRFIHGEALNP